MENEKIQVSLAQGTGCDRVTTQLWISTQEYEKMNEVAERYPAGYWDNRQMDLLNLAKEEIRIEQEEELEKAHDAEIASKCGEDYKNTHSLFLECIEIAQRKGLLGASHVSFPVELLEKAHGVCLKHSNALSNYNANHTFSERVNEDTTTFLLGMATGYLGCINPDLVNSKDIYRMFVEENTDIKYLEHRLLSLLDIEEDGGYYHTLKQCIGYINKYIEENTKLSHIEVTKVIFRLGAIVQHQNEHQKIHIEKSFAENISNFKRAIRYVDIDSHETFNFILHLVPAIKLKEGYVLDGYLSGRYSFRNLYVHRKDARMPYKLDKEKYSESKYDKVLFDDNMFLDNNPDIRVQTPEPLVYFTVPFTLDGITQAWLIAQAGHLMNFASFRGGEIILDKRQIQEICDLFLNEPKWDASKEKLLQIGDKCMPHIKITNEYAVITTWYWNINSGLIRIKELALREENTITFKKVSSDVIVEYESDIRF